MFELNQLEQLLAIDEYKTLSKAAEHLNISQPALSRSIQRLEEELEVTLFERQKNKLTFNEDGVQALDYAKRILELSHEMKESLVSAAKARRTISIGSIAPAPMWLLSPEISRLHPEMMIQSELETGEKLEKGLQDGTYQIIITNDPTVDKDTIAVEYCEEDLYVALPPAHPLASRNELSLSDLNGQSILQYRDVGFWLDICKAKMPNSMFLMQDEFAVLDELRRSSALPSFATNLTGNVPESDHRVMVPLTDDEVNVIFYIKYKKAGKALFKDVAPLT
ncbi:MAG: LysR family transcriptional regulator [Lachnospiraceae bacterium]|nr:LysR family transcriptional regulator [Lachnospiraceae bacterium]